MADQRDEVVSEFFEGELPDHEKTKQEGTVQTRQALLVRIQAGEFSSVVREATEEDKQRHQGHYKAFMDKKEFEKFKNVGPGAQPESIKGDQRDEAFAGRPQPGNEPNPELGKSPEGKRDETEPTRMAPDHDKELRDEYGKSPAASGTQDEPPTTGKGNKGSKDAEKKQDDYFHADKPENKSPFDKKNEGE